MPNENFGGCRMCVPGDSMSASEKMKDAVPLSPKNGIPGTAATYNKTQHLRIIQTTPKGDSLLIL